MLRLNLLPAGANKQFAAECGVERTPSCVLFDGNGQELKRWVGTVPSLGELPPG